MPTWGDFQVSVREFLTVDAVRLNIQTLVDKLIRQGVIDLQSFVPEMRLPHETKYGPADLTEDAFASAGTLPDQARPISAMYVKDEEECIQAPITMYPWASRQDLICGNIRIKNCQYAIAISPQATTFYVYPKVESGRHLSLFWEGIKLEFADADTVPFGERAAMAVAMFVKAGVVREVDKDPLLAATYLGRVGAPGTYVDLRSSVYLDERSRRSIVDTEDSPQANDRCANVVGTC